MCARWAGRRSVCVASTWKPATRGGRRDRCSDATLLVAGENGIGKRTAFDEYRVQSRGGKGIITMKTGDKTGGVVGALTVREHDEIMLITTGGKMVRTRVAEIREAGRNTQGVKLINLAKARFFKILRRS